MANPLAVATVQVMTLRCSLIAHPVFWFAVFNFAVHNARVATGVPNPNSVLHSHLRLPSRARLRWDKLRTL